MHVKGGFYLDEFVAQGGAKSDSELIDFVTAKITKGLISMGISDPEIGCSSFTATSESGDVLYEELNKTGGVAEDEQAAMEILQIVGRRTWDNDDGNGCTVHSVVYNLTDKTMMWIPNENYDDPDAVFTFQLDNPGK